MNSLNRFGIEADLRVLERGNQHATIDRAAVLDTNIRVDSKYLAEFCFSQADARLLDLMTVVGAVRWADRAVKRHHAVAWARRIRVDIPVLERDVWGSRKVITALESCLNYLTGDEWHFVFRARKRKPKFFGQMPVPARIQHDRVFVPYSHGLDSYAQVRLLQDAEPNTEVACVFTDTKATERTWKESLKKQPRGGIRAISVPVTVDEPHHSEPSFRTRPFLYYVLAGCGAMLSSRRVMIPENGQGSLAGSLVALGAEAKHRSCHPGFTSRLAAFLYELSGSQLSFAHPSLYETKGEVFIRLAKLEVNSASWLSEHWSCSHDQRHSTANGTRVHCGVCGNCLLRRVSAFAAGLHDVTEYKFADFTAADLASSIREPTGVERFIKAFEDLAGNTARTMERMAICAGDPDHPSIWAEAAELAQGERLGVSDAHKKLNRLLTQHAAEWRAFVGQFPQGWLSKMTGAR